MPEGKPVIPPTIGRRVLLFLATQPAGVTPNDPKVPYDAGIAYAWSAGPESNAINVGFRDHGGNAHSYTSVRLFDRAVNDSDRHGNTELGNYAVWMEYQFEQAQRAAQKAADPLGQRPAAPIGTVQDLNALKTHENDAPVRRQGGEEAAA